MKNAIIIGSGIGGLATAGILGKAGYKVTVFEKNEQVGGRASVLKEKGYTFDMGPSWYLMPEIFENYFNLLGEKVEDYLDLVKLSPSYRIFFKDNGRFKDPIDVFSDIKKTLEIFEVIEPGCSENFKQFLKESEFKYDVSLKSFLYQNYDSVLDFINEDSIKYGYKLNIFKKMQKYVEKYFKTPELQKIMQYTLVFLGSSPYNTPAIYSLMTHVDFNGGVFFPMGGMYSLVEAMEKVAKKNEVEFVVNTPVKQILVKDGKAFGVELEDGQIFEADIVISNADMEHTETKLLPAEFQTYDQKYWDKKVVAPSGFIMYLGIDKELPMLKHHSFIFAEDWKQGFAEIFDNPQTPTDPSIYICNPNKTDPSLAPAGKENLFILVPIAAGLSYSEEQKEAFGQKILETLSKELGVPDLIEKVEYKKYFTPEDFIERYHSIRGTALGLAHTLFQTGYFRPNNVSKKVENLYYVGQNTNPGIGVPMCIISGELVYKRIIGDKSNSALKNV